MSIERPTSPSGSASFQATSPSQVCDRSTTSERTHGTDTASPPAAPVTPINANIADQESTGTSSPSWDHTPSESMCEEGVEAWPNIVDAEEDRLAEQCPTILPTASSALSASEALTIINYANTPGREGDRVYLIDRRWFNHFREWALGQDKLPPGRISTTHIVDSNGHLKPGLTEDDIVGMDYEYWTMLQLHYGEPNSPVFERRLVKSGNDLKIELYPPVIYLFRITSLCISPTNFHLSAGSNNDNNDDNDNNSMSLSPPCPSYASYSQAAANASTHPPAITVSAVMTLTELRDIIYSVACLPDSAIVRLWRFKQSNVAPTVLKSPQDSNSQHNQHQQKQQDVVGEEGQELTDSLPSYEGSLTSIQPTDTLIAPNDIPSGATVIELIDDTYLRDVGLDSGSIVAYEVKYNEHDPWPTDLTSPLSPTSASSQTSPLSYPPLSTPSSPHQPSDYAGIDSPSDSPILDSTFPALKDRPDSQPMSPAFPFSSSSSSLASSPQIRHASSMFTSSAPPQDLSPEFTPGLCGLINLGNTCYMNSALQCLSNTPALKDYFKAGIHTDEINPQNPLAKDGDIAMAYGSLVTKMWSGQYTSFRPYEFKAMIGRHSYPNYPFAGYGQQDAPEFVAFLLDCLHEDLNRIKNKPYIEIPGSNDRPDHELADEQWDIYKKRNDSVIVDLFQGQYRSKLQCPECKETSTTFDPFMYLTLPIPIKRKIFVDILYIPSDPRLAATEMRLCIDKDGTIGQMKELIARLKGVPSAKQLLAVEVYNHRIFQVFSDMYCVDEISRGDQIVVYQLAVDVNQIEADDSTSSYDDSDCGSGHEEDSNSRPNKDNALVCVLFTEMPLSDKSEDQPSCYHLSDRYSPNLFGDPLLLCIDKGQVRTVGHLYIQIARWFQRCVPSGMLGSLIQRFEQIISISIVDREDSSGSSAASSSSDDWTLENILELTSLIRFRVSRARGSTSADPENRHQRFYGTGFGRFGGGRPGTHANSTQFSRLSRQVDWDRLEPLVGAASKSQESSSLPTSQMEIEFADKAGGSGSASEAEGDANPAEMDAATDAGEKEREPDLKAQEEAETKSDQQMQGAAMNIEDTDGSEEQGGLTDIGSWLCQKVELHTNDIIVCECDTRGIAEFVTRQAAFSNGEASSPTPTHGGKDREDLAMFARSKASKYRMPRTDGPTDAEKLPLVPDVPIGTARQDSPGDERDSSLAVTQDVREDTPERVTLQRCIEEFTKPEQLGDADSWYCSKCKKHMQAHKKFDIWRVPEFLVIHLKRFEQARSWRKKLSGVVDFPIEGLDLTDVVAGNSEKRRKLNYDLYAVCEHMGGMGGGHYTALAKHADTGEWYHFNDSHVSKARGEPDEIVTGAAYMLFYRLRPEVGEEGPGSEKVSRLIKEHWERETATRQRQAAMRASDGNYDDEMGERESGIGKPAVEVGDVADGQQLKESTSGVTLTIVGVEAKPRHEDNADSLSEDSLCCASEPDTTPDPSSAATTVLSAAADRWDSLREGSDGSEDTLTSSPPLSVTEGDSYTEVQEDGEVERNAAKKDRKTWPTPKRIVRNTYKRIKNHRKNRMRGNSPRIRAGSNSSSSKSLSVNDGSDIGDSDDLTVDLVDAPSSPQSLDSPHKRTSPTYMSSAKVRRRTSATAESIQMDAMEVEESGGNGDRNTA
ncbi:hypothetical protein EV182_000600 [Spiromyces aspiralis]|uniref:Uncharacterized protein n=1 Tax=Spiromyces aspiralis TaxID=68401 RepID=A0ACC1HKB0_9FUNG|nr:hypothetical protein EV182_000600 [Spiromyces aspiralis]